MIHEYKHKYDYLFISFLYIPTVKIGIVIYTLLFLKCEDYLKITVQPQRHLLASSGTQWQKSIMEPN